MIDPPFNWKVYHPHVLYSYKECHLREGQAAFAAWRAENRHNIHTQVAELTRDPYEPFHPAWHELWRQKTDASVDPGRSFVEKLLLRDVFDAVCRCYLLYLLND